MLIYRTLFLMHPDTFVMQQVLSALREKLPGFSPKLRQAGKLVLDKPATVATASMREFAREAGVTPPTLERLAEALRYDSYAELKSDFLHEINTFSFEQRASSLQQNNELNGEDAIIRELQKAAQSNIDFYYRHLNIEHINRAADLMINAETVYLMASNAPHWIAAYMQYVGKMAVPNIRVPRTCGDGLIDGLIPLTNKDAVLAMSYSPYSRQTIEAMDFAISNGASIIYLTDSDAAPMAEKADVVILQSTESPQFFPSMVAVVTAIETLLAVTVARSGPETVDAVAKYSQLRQQRYVTA